MLASTHRLDVDGRCDFFDCILYSNSSRMQAGGCQLTHLTQQVNTPISLKYLAGLSVVILKIFSSHYKDSQNHQKTKM